MGIWSLLLCRGAE